MRALFASVAAAIVLTSAARASAQEAPDHRRDMWRLELGYRGSLVADSGFDPFSKSDVLPQVSLALSRTLVSRGGFSFAPGIAWDFGKSSATARGDAASLSVHRLTVPLEGRVHFGAWGYAFLRAAPGVLFESARVDDGAAPAPLVKSRPVFATDVSAGYAWLAWPWSDPEHLCARLWLQSDVGYGWAVKQRLDLAPDLADGDPQRTGSVDLGSLVLRGPFFRIAAAVSF